MKKRYIAIIIILAIVISILIISAISDSETGRTIRCEKACEDKGFSFYNYLEINKECWCDNPDANLTVIYTDET